MKVRMFIAVLLLIASLFTVVSAQDQRPALVVAVQGLPPTLEPIRENSNVFARFVYNVFEPLIEFDARTFELKPLLAERWTRIDDRTLEVTLRQGVRFHNGAEMTAQDVVFTFGSERMFNEERPGFGNARQFFGVLESVEMVDEYTVRFVTNQPDPLLEQRLTVQVAGIVSQAAFESADDYDAFSRAGIGTGPYRVAEFVTDDFARLEPFADHWSGEEADFSSITLRIVPEVAARVAGLIAGDYGIITDLPPDQFAVIEGADGVSVTGGPIRNIRVIVYDKNNNDVLADPRIRQALNLAIDRELIVEALFNNTTEVPASMQFPYYNEMFLDDWAPQAYDPEQARALLAEAGYDGQEIIYRLLPGYYTFQVETAQIMQQMWREVGLNVTLQVVENWSQVLDTANGRYIWDLSTTMMYPDPVGHLYRLYGANGLVPNGGSWSNEQFDALGQTLATTTELETRRDAFRQMLDIWQNQDPAGTYLYYLTIFYGKQNNLDWEPTVYEYLDLRPGNIEVIN